MSLIDRIRLRYNDWRIQRNLRVIYKLFRKNGADHEQANAIVIKVIKEIPILDGSPRSHEIMRARMMKAWVVSS